MGQTRQLGRHHVQTALVDITAMLVQENVCFVHQENMQRSVQANAKSAVLGLTRQPDRHHVPRVPLICFRTLEVRLVSHVHHIDGY